MIRSKRLHKKDCVCEQCFEESNYDEAIKEYDVNSGIDIKDYLANR